MEIQTTKAVDAVTRHLSTRKVVLVSFLVDLLDVVTNLIVVLLTGSAVVFSEMAQGIADSFGSALLVIGERRATRAGNARHPLGYSREAFFWGLLSAVAMMIFGSGLSAWRGFQQLLDPRPLETPLLAVAVLVLAIFTNGYAVSLSARKLGIRFGGIRAAFVNFHRPLVKGAFVRDVIGTFTSIVGLFALFLYTAFGMVIFDALGALFAAGCMAVGSLALISQARALITGRSVPEENLQELRKAILTDSRVDAVKELVAIYAGAFEVLVDVELDLREDLKTKEIESVLDSIGSRVQEIMPEINRVRVLLKPPLGAPDYDPENARQRLSQT